ncbi:hypothetical protein ACV229_20730 [Burkholderia sp. MR1-5-21]
MTDRIVRCARRSQAGAIAGATDMFAREPGEPGWASLSRDECGRSHIQFHRRVSTSPSRCSRITNSTRKRILDYPIQPVGNPHAKRLSVLMIETAAGAACLDRNAGIRPEKKTGFRGIRISDNRGHIFCINSNNSIVEFQIFKSSHVVNDVA